MSGANRDADLGVEVQAPELQLPQVARLQQVAVGLSEVVHRAQLERADRRDLQRAEPDRHGAAAPSLTRWGIAVLPVLADDLERTVAERGRLDPEGVDAREEWASVPVEERDRIDLGFRAAGVRLRVGGADAGVAGEPAVSPAGGGGGRQQDVRSSIGWTLGANLENLTLTGATAINGTGNALANLLAGTPAAQLSRVRARDRARLATLIGRDSCPDPSFHPARSFS